MKKQVFLLTLMSVFFASNVRPTCDTACTTTCATTTDCSNTCNPDHGKTFLSVTPHFQNASPEYASMFNSNYLHDLNAEDKHGNFQVVVFGGKNTGCANSASYFLPYGHKTLTFDGSIKNPMAFASNVAESVVQATLVTTAGADLTVTGEFAIGGAATTPSTMRSDPVTYWMDSNRDTSKILPWNFGITFAALFEPRGVNGAIGDGIGTGLITAPTFKSTVAPTFKYSHVGAGLALRYHFSDDKNGFFGCISTAVQNVRSKICLNEDVTAAAQVINATNFPAANPNGTIAPIGIATTITNSSGQGLNTTVYDPAAVSTVATVGSIATAYIGSGFPNATDAGTTVHGVVIGTAPVDVTSAFAQDAWKYGRIDGCNKITRLADIELSLGYQWFCGDCASTNWSLGVVIPTGNKPNAVNLAQAVVGNGLHAGIFSGSVTEVMLSDEEDYQTSYRLDLDARYLFRNTQARSFDLVNNEWSRYMMVWANKAAYTAALAVNNTLTVTGGGVTTTGVGLGLADRAYTPGINVFTTDMYVKPGFQFRVNQALNIRGEHFRAELGWNILAKHKECVSLACAWSQAPAFADSSYLSGTALNNNRTIYNDAQTSAYNVVDSLTRVSPASTPTTLNTIAAALLADTNYSYYAIGEDQINLDSASSSAVLSQTPYATVGYAWESDYQPQFSVGGSYEFSPSNHALNQWLVWGKFEIAF